MVHEFRKSAARKAFEAQSDATVTSVPLPEGPEKWVPEAIAEQEEYIRRISGCGGVVGKGHDFQTFRGPDSAVPVPNEVTWKQCAACDVTETRDDYARKLEAQN